MTSNGGLMCDVALRKSSARKFAKDALKVFCGDFGSFEWDGMPQRAALS